MKPAADKTRKPADKTRKQPVISRAKPIKSCCGTLSHIAERRGAFLKKSDVRWQGSADTTDRIVRKFSV